MFLGIDASTYLEVLALKPKYLVEGKEVEPLSYLHDVNGVSSFRIRLWLDPFSKSGEAYHGGTNDWPTFLKTARLAMSKGYSILLDFHYSDFWCDPSKQMIPKAWSHLSFEEVLTKVYEHTRDTLKECLKEKLDIRAIQLGNEITNGMLWPLGKLEYVEDLKRRIGYPNLLAILSEASKAAHEVMPNALRIIHLERSYDWPTYQEFFDEVTSYGLEYEVIGLSYYPYWHHGFDDFFFNVDHLKAKYHKPIWIVETGYGFTMAPFVENGNNLISDEFFTKNAGTVYKPYPLTKEGQNEFVKELIRLSKIHEVEAIYYWEPLWLPLPGLEWASKAGEAYIGETNKPTNNEWANQCLFDYEGKANPALFSYRVK